MEAKGVILGHHLGFGIGDYDIFVHTKYPILVDELSKNSFLSKIKCQIAMDFQERNPEYVYMGSIEFNDQGFDELMNKLKKECFEFKYNGH